MLTPVREKEKISLKTYQLWLLASHQKKCNRYGLLARSCSETKISHQTYVFYIAFNQDCFSNIFTTPSMLYNKKNGGARAKNLLKLLLQIFTNFHKFFKKYFVAQEITDLNFSWRSIFSRVYFMASPINFSFLFKAYLQQYFREVLTVIFKFQITKKLTFTIIFKK